MPGPSVFEKASTRDVAVSATGRRQDGVGCLGIGGESHGWRLLIQPEKRAGILGGQCSTRQRLQWLSVSAGREHNIPRLTARREVEDRQTLTASLDQPHRPGPLPTRQAGPNAPRARGGVAVFRSAPARPGAGSRPRALHIGDPDFGSYPSFRLPDFQTFPEGETLA